MPQFSGVNFAPCFEGLGAFKAIPIIQLCTKISDTESLFAGCSVSSKEMKFLRSTREREVVVRWAAVLCMLGIYITYVLSE